MAGIAANLQKTYTSMSGTDIIMRFNDYKINTALGLTLTITREKIPVYVMGRVNPVSISRSKRALAGSIIFNIFDRDPLYEMAMSTNSQYYAHEDEADFLRDIVDGIGFKAAQQATGPVRIRRVPAKMLDQIQPYDITIVAANEMGNLAYSVIVGVDTLSQSYSISTEDTATQLNSTFICLYAEPFKPILSADGTTMGGTYNEVSISDVEQLFNNPNLTETTPVATFIGGQYTNPYDVTIQQLGLEWLTGH